MKIGMYFEMLILNREHGAKIATFGNKHCNGTEMQKMLVGIMRIMRPETSYLGEYEPHFDHLPSCEFKLQKQLAANIYLQVPSCKGELEIWHTTECKETDVPPKHWRNMLGQSELYKPNVGDLVIINTRLPHAIRGFDDSMRISTNCFVGYNEGEPLHLWN